LKQQAGHQQENDNTLHERMLLSQRCEAGRFGEGVCSDSKGCS
jgi:hypothetical protein